MTQAYLIGVDAPGRDGSSPEAMRYAAMAETPEEAIALVRRLTSSEAVLLWTGETLSAAAAQAVGLRPGQARLV